MNKWGLDHGAWSVIKHLYPDADVPVIEMSLDYYQAPQYHYELAKELRSLREKGVLIIGSGNMVHNLGLVAWDKLSADEFGFDWALEASGKMKNFILNGDHQSLINYSHKADRLNSQFQPLNIICLCCMLLLYKMKMINQPCSMTKRCRGIDYDIGDNRRSISYFLRQRTDSPRCLGLLLLPKLLLCAR